MDAEGAGRLTREQRRGQLLAVAQELFSAGGYHHVSMDDIAEHAHVTKPVLYRHFPSKLDLYLAIVDALGQDLLTAIDDAVRPVVAGTPGDGRDVVAAIVRAYVTFVDAAGEVATLLFESDVTHDPAVRGRVESASRDAAQRIADVLAHVTDLAPQAARTVAVGLVAMAQGAAIHRLRRDDAPSAEETADLVARVAWAGVAGLVRPARRADEGPGAATT
ncbi:MAG: TetR family transcriptional regulator [Cellulomonas sp. 73-92]|uniref:TetR/AcrR family transcriptional regulator n=1 Tax=Cellulomonas sp. 73-92 TaxID=1895740 RepID=UPI000927CEDB|nr:TetR/AcrR family transcriptional regulator [Cellulomonas sp. 73-92]OJV82233.1 MAG: TetR family transcriptional regulator [Cellulomonas sp. 73-92]